MNRAAEIEAIVQHVAAYEEAAQERVATYDISGIYRQLNRNHLPYTEYHNAASSDFPISALFQILMKWEVKIDANRLCVDGSAYDVVRKLPGVLWINKNWDKWSVPERVDHLCEWTTNLFAILKAAGQ